MCVGLYEVADAAPGRHTRLLLGAVIGRQGHYWYVHERDADYLGGDGGRMKVLGDWKLGTFPTTGQGMVHVPDTGAQTHGETDGLAALLAHPLPASTSGVCTFRCRRSGE
jgi:hypothetical protein